MNPAYSTMTPTEGTHQPLYEDTLVHPGAAVSITSVIHMGIKVS